MYSREQSPNPYASDSESGVSDGRDGLFHPELQSGWTRLAEHDSMYLRITDKLVSCLGLQPPAEVVSIFRRKKSVLSAKSNWDAFQIYSEALSTKNHGVTNTKYAWFGAPKDEIRKIVSFGFGHQQINLTSGDLFGHGVYLSPHESPLASVQAATEDENGIRHVLFCKVLLGNMEVIEPGSEQTHPSSEEFDTGVDNLESPKRYIVWSTKMNTHILVGYIVSFKAVINTGSAPRLPRSPWMTVTSLLPALSAVLDPDRMSAVNQRYIDFTISKAELVRTIRRAAGDEWLEIFIRSYNSKLQG